MSNEKLHFWPQHEITNVALADGLPQQGLTGVALRAVQVLDVELVAYCASRDRRSLDMAIKAAERCLEAMKAELAQPPR